MDKTTIIIGIMCGLYVVLFLFMLYIARELDRITSEHKRRLDAQANSFVAQSHRIGELEAFRDSRTPCKICGMHRYTEPEQVG